MSKSNQKLNFSSFPVSNLYAVYEDQGKYFKTKVHAFVIVDSVEDGDSFKDIIPITAEELRNGISIDPRNEPTTVSNFVGYLDEEEWVEMKPDEYLTGNQITNRKYALMEMEALKLKLK